MYSPDTYSSESASSSSASSSASSSVRDVAIEQTQLIIRIKDAVINYSKKDTIDFKPYMLDLPPSPSGSSGSGEPRLFIYLPDRHNVPYMFDKNYKLYKTTIGNPALVFVDKKMFSDYMQFAREFIKKEPTNSQAVPQLKNPDEKVKMINNNIVFIVNTLFRKNRVIVTGNKKDRIQTKVGGKPVIVAQSYYLDTYLMDEISYGSSSDVKKKYYSGDTIIFDKETEANKIKDEIDATFKPARQAAEKKWIDAKDAYSKAVSASSSVSSPVVASLKDAVDKTRDEYNQARDEEKDKMAERDKIVSEINQVRYGKENRNVTSILEEISRQEKNITDVNKKKNRRVK